MRRWLRKKDMERSVASSFRQIRARNMRTKREILRQNERLENYPNTKSVSIDRFASVHLSEF